jgi:uncharacterized repeat protein (TIGR01451 family)
VRKGFVSIVLAAGLVAATGVQLASAKILVVTKADSEITLNASPTFSGKVKSDEPACRSDRRVRIYDGISGALLTKTTTNSKGEFSKSSSFTGPAFAKVTKRRLSGDQIPDLEDGIEGGEDVLVCKKAFSAVVGGVADLAISKNFVAADCQGDCVETYMFTVGNSGPNTASSAVVTEFLPPGWTPLNSSIPCTNNGNGTLSCALGDLAPGQVVQFTITFGMDSNDSCETNTASVASGTSDPNLANNQDSDSRPC